MRSWFLRERPAARPEEAARLGRLEAVLKAHSEGLPSQWGKDAGRVIRLPSPRLKPEQVDKLISHLKGTKPMPPYARRLRAMASPLRRLFQ
jgi:hypothetical protein